MGQTPNKRWNTGELAFLGVFLGMGIAGVHCAWYLLGGELPNKDPFLYVLLELAAGTLGFALLFASLSELRNWLVMRGL